MEYLVRVIETAGGTAAQDELLDLYSWLLDEETFRAEPRLVESPPAPGTLGGAIDAVLYSVPPGVGIGAVARVWIAWLKTRRVKISVEVEGNKIVLDGMTGLTVEQAQSLIDESTRALQINDESN